MLVPSRMQATASTFAAPPMSSPPAPQPVDPTDWGTKGRKPPVTWMFAGSHVATLACPQPKGASSQASPRVRVKAPPAGITKPKPMKAPPASVTKARAASARAAADAQVAAAEAKAGLLKAAHKASARAAHKNPVARAPTPMLGIPEDEGFVSTWPLPQDASAPASATSSAPAPAVAPAASKAPPPINSGAQGPAT